MATTEALNAPILNTLFYLTGAWGEQRTGHIHAGVDLSTGQKKEIVSMYKGKVIRIDKDGSTGSGYRTLYYNKK